MKKIIIPIVMIILLVSITLALTPSMARELPSSAIAGQTFTMNLEVHGTDGNYGVLYTTDITGGCTSVSGKTHIAGGFLGEADKTVSVTINTPSSAGTCTFTGDYQFADASGTYSQVDFSQQSVTITENGKIPIWIYIVGIGFVAFILFKKSKK